jgi:hypothetical protein
VGAAEAGGGPRTALPAGHIDEEVLPRLAKGRKEQVAETLSRIRVGLDPGIGLKDEEGNTPPMPIPVSSMIKALARQAERTMPVDEDDDEDESGSEMMTRFYSVLSDYTHPNQSAGHLSSSIDETTWMMDWTFDHAWDEPTAFHVLGTTYLAMHFAGEAFDAFMGALTKHPLVLEDKRKKQGERKP